MSCICVFVLKCYLSRDLFWVADKAKNLAAAPPAAARARGRNGLDLDSIVWVLRSWCVGLTSIDLVIIVLVGNLHEGVVIIVVFIQDNVGIIGGVLRSWCVGLTSIDLVIIVLVGNLLGGNLLLGNLLGGNLPRRPPSRLPKFVRPWLELCTALPPLLGPNFLPPFPPMDK